MIARRYIDDEVAPTRVTQEVASKVLALNLVMDQRHAFPPFEVFQRSVWLRASVHARSSTSVDGNLAQAERQAPPGEFFNGLRDSRYRACNEVWMTTPRCML